MVSRCLVNVSIIIKKMNKLILLIAVAVWMTAPAHAQLNIEKMGEKPKEVATLTSMWNWLYTIEDCWFIVTKTTNQFDDRIWIMLGDTPEKAVESIDQLLTLLDEMSDDDIFEITTREKKTVRVGIYKQLGTRQGFTVFSDDAAGVGYIYKGGIKKAKVAILGEQNKRAAGIK